MMRRREMIGTTALGLAAAGLPAFARGAVRARPPLIDDIAERTFRFFWDTTNPRNGLAPDRFPSPSPASIAAVGFALNAYPIGVERGWIDRRAAAQRTLATLRFLWTAKQGPAAHGMTGHKGFFYHFLDMQTGERHGDSELSTIDTALMLGGMLFAAGYFDRDDRFEAEIRSLAQRIYARVDWTWFAPQAPLLSMGWHPGRGYILSNWSGYNEGMLLYILALGSPTHPLPAAAWQAWTAGYQGQWIDRYGHKLLGFSPLFGHQYSHVWVDFRGICDAPMRRAGWDYFENSRRATLVQQAYATANPMGWADYGATIWGQTACDGPGGGERAYHGRQRAFRGYSARGSSGVTDFDDGTIAPTAALGSFAFAPREATAAAEAMVNRYGARLYGCYGFLDSFNPSFQEKRAATAGTVYSDIGWVDSDYLGIDQGPILAMIENQRTGLIWQVMRRNAYIRTGLTRAGFRGGWLDAG